MEGQTDVKDDIFFQILVICLLDKFYKNGCPSDIMLIFPSCSRIYRAVVVLRHGTLINVIITFLHQMNSCISIYIYAMKCFRCKQKIDHFTQKDSICRGNVSNPCPRVLPYHGSIEVISIFSY